MSNNNNEIPKHLVAAAYNKIIQAPVESFERAGKEEIIWHGWTNIKLSLGNGVVIMISDNLEYICVTVQVYGNTTVGPTCYYRKDQDISTESLEKKFTLVHKYIREKEKNEEKERLHKDCMHALKVINASLL